MIRSRSPIQLGPRTRLIAACAKWSRSGDFPATQAFSDEVEQILDFLVAQDQFERFLPRLKANSRARDSALAEARVAFFFFRNRFRIIEWDPPGRDGHVGEFVVRWLEESPVFVEVKAPDWEGELKPEERSAGRKEFGKWIDCEARATDPCKQALEVVEHKAVPKLLDDRPNLVVVVDNLFVSPLEAPFLPACVEELFGKPSNHRLGGVLFFGAESTLEGIHYRIRFFANSNATADCRIPPPIAEGLRISSEPDEH